jgi:hypothetical protein
MSGVWLMLEFVARENIKRFEYQLSGTTDETERKLLVRMLREEKEKLEVITSKHSANSGIPLAGENAQIHVWRW